MRARAARAEVGDRNRLSVVEERCRRCVIGLLETKRGRRIGGQSPLMSKLTSSRRSLQAFWKLFYPSNAPPRHRQPCDCRCLRYCLAARCRLALQHDARNAGSQTFTRPPSLLPRQGCEPKRAAWGKLGCRTASVLKRIPGLAQLPHAAKITYSTPAPTACTTTG